MTRGRVVLLAFTLFLSYGYFYQGGGWNQDSRFSMVRAILESGTLKITAYHHITGDKSRIGADYYSDKAPGHALLATPFGGAAPRRNEGRWRRDHVTGGVDVAALLGDLDDRVVTGLPDHAGVLVGQPPAGRP